MKANLSRFKKASQLKAPMQFVGAGLSPDRIIDRFGNLLKTSWQSIKRQQLIASMSQRTRGLGEHAGGDAPPSESTYRAEPTSMIDEIQDKLDTATNFQDLFKNTHRGGV